VNGPPGMGLVAAAAVLILGLRAWTSIAPARVGASQPARKLMSGPTRRGRPATDLDVAAWCDDVARAIRTGASLTSAVRDCVDHPAVAPVTDPIVARLSRGQSLSTALRGTPADAATPVGLALAVLRSCADVGGPAASPLERVAATLRDRNAIREEQRSQSAQAQMSARVMTLVPIGMLTLLATTDPNVRQSIGTPAGVAAVTAGAVLNVAGWRWMQRIIGRRP